MKKFTNLQLKWLHQPKEFNIKDNHISITTQPNTDYWQRTYYGFQNDNAPILYTELKDNFTFEVRNVFKFNKLYDHCGPIVYQDCDNWFKIGAEYENEKVYRLGSVVTNLGYSDWATTDISSSINDIYYRVSRRGQDFLIEYSYDGKQYHQMRILHMHKHIDVAKVGIFACSPLNSSYTAEFYDPLIKQCVWNEYKAPEN